MFLLNLYDTLKEFYKDKPIEYLNQSLNFVKQQEKEYKHTENHQKKREIYIHWDAIENAIFLQENQKIKLPNKIKA